MSLHRNTALHLDNLVIVEKLYFLTGNLRNYTRAIKNFPEYYFTKIRWTSSSFLVGFRAPSEAADFVFLTYFETAKPVHGKA